MGSSLTSLTLARTCFPIAQKIGFLFHGILEGHSIDQISRYFCPQTLNAVLTRRRHVSVFCFSE